MSLFPTQKQEIAGLHDALSLREMENEGLHARIKELEAEKALVIFNDDEIERGIEGYYADQKVIKASVAFFPYFYVPEEGCIVDAEKELEMQEAWEKVMLAYIAKYPPTK